MDQINEFIDNIIIPFIAIHGLTLFVTLCLLLVVYPFFVNNKNLDEDEDEDFTIEGLRDFIEDNRLTQNDEKYSNRILQSIILPKKGDYILIEKGRWKGYVGRVTKIIDFITHNLFNINVSKKDNYEYGNDIPHFLLKEKERDFFSVLTDKEIHNFNLIDKDEYMNRYLLTNY